MRAARDNPVAVFTLAFALVCALLLALPAQTVTTRYVNDLFVFLDGAHRIAEGQVPNRDFHTALGPLVYYLPALGRWLSGTMGGAMPVGMALLLIAMAPVAAWIVGSRLRPAIAVPLAAYLLLVLAVPANLGESIAALSFAMFYNRIGWAALGLLLVLYLPPPRHSRWQAPLDAACAAVLVLLMIYTKISYGAVGGAFLVLALLVSPQRRWAAGAIGLVLVGCLAVEAVWGGSASHLADLALAGRVSGSLGTPDKLGEVVLRNLADYVVFGMLAAFVLWRTRSLRHGLFFGFCAGAGFALMSQNFQHAGMITLGAGGAVAAALLTRTDRAAPPHRTLAAGAPLALLALLAPAIVHMGATLGLHAGLAAAPTGTAVPLNRFEGIRLAELWTGGEYPAFRRYFDSLEDGAQALRDLDRAPERVLVLDFVNPFSAGLGLPSAKADSTWYHWDRTINDAHHLPAERLFRDVRIVLEPKSPIEHWTAAGMRQLYGSYLEEHFALAQETAEWKVHVARPSPPETVSRTPDTGASLMMPRSARGG
jgi:hypothetical protein